MYSNIKKIILRIVPKQILFQHEYKLRYLYYLFYTGNKFQCNVCNKKLSNFVLTYNNKLCPRCGSLQRTRRLWEILSSQLIKEQTKILDFSPSRSIYRLLRTNTNYLSTDLSGDFLADATYDITKINVNNNTYDLIICYHVLEHIDDDMKAMQELFRVLKTGGKCVIQTPFKSGEILEDNTIVTAKEREQHFGQADHVRIYSVQGLKKRLEKVGFAVNEKNFKENSNNLHGFKEKETVLICTKQ